MKLIPFEKKKINVNIYEMDIKSKEWGRSNGEEGQDWSKSSFL